MEREDARDEDRINLIVYLCLLALTALTLTAAHFGQGRLMAVSIALIIASGKAGLIGFYYMDLRRERPFMCLLLAVGFTAVAILLFGMLPDMTVFRR